MTAKEQGLPEPAFRLKWKNGAYYVDKPNVDDTDCYTADQMRAYALASRPADSGERGVVAGLEKKWRERSVMLEANQEQSAAVQVLMCANELAAALRAQPAGGGVLDWREMYHDRRRVISDWHQRAVALGYEGVNDLLTLALPCIVNNAGDERPTPPESGGQGEAVAWAFEQDDGWGEYEKRLAYSRAAGERQGCRNLQPLYTHPPAQASGAVTVPASYVEAMTDLVTWLDSWRRKSVAVGKEAAEANGAIDAAIAADAALTQGGGNGR